MTADSVWRLSRSHRVVLGVGLGLLLLVGGLLIGWPAKAKPARAAGTDPIYMNYDNLNIKGDVLTAPYENWIQLTSFQWGMGRAVSAPTGTREASAPSISEVTITKPMDKSSVPLLTNALQGSPKTVVIAFVQGTGTSKEPEKYLQFTLDNTLISGYSVSSGGTNPTESLSLNFTKILVEQWNFDSTGLLLSHTSVSYDLARQVVG